MQTVSAVDLSRSADAQALVRDVEVLGNRLAAVREMIGRVIYGQEEVIDLSLVTLLAGGHLLLIGVPGLAKTRLVETLATVLGLDERRIQCTPDLMPADILGSEVLEETENGRRAFRFLPGPVFSQLLMADEINRASPRTQSALLEAMEERQVTVEGETRPLPSPFFVIATQNPLDQLGTYALPESQLDRFHMRLSLGYPDRQAERELLQGHDRRAMLAQLPAVLGPGELSALQKHIQTIHTADPVLDYLQDLVAATRNGRWFVQGLSPRAAIAVVRAGQAQAFLSGRNYVAPDDIAAILPQTIAHRLSPLHNAGRGAQEQVRAMVEATPLP